MDVDAEQSLVFTGAAEGEMKAWRIDHDAMESGLQESDSGEVTKMIHPITTLPLSSKHRVAQITFHPTRPYLAVQSHDRSVEIFRIRSEEEVRKKQARRKKRANEKKTQAKKEGKAKDVDDVEAQEEEIALPDLFTPYLVVRASGKVRSFAFADSDVASNSKDKGNTQIFLSLATNALEVYSIPAPAKKEGPPEANRTLSVDLPGHRSDVRTMCLSSDDVLLASASNGALLRLVVTRMY